MINLEITETTAKDVASAIRSGTRPDTIEPIVIANVVNWGVFSSAGSREVVEALREQKKSILKEIKSLKEDAPVPSAEEPTAPLVAPKDSVNRIQKVRAVQAYVHERLAEQKKLSEITRSGLTKAQQQEIIDVGIAGKLMATAVRVAYTESMEVAFAREDLDVLETLRADIDSKYPTQPK